jgi:hypothetical protein
MESLGQVVARMTSRDDTGMGQTQSMQVRHDLARTGRGAALKCYPGRGTFCRVEFIGSSRASPLHFRPDLLVEPVSLICVFASPRGAY